MFLKSKTFFEGKAYTSQRIIFKGFIQKYQNNNIKDLSINKVTDNQLFWILLTEQNETISPDLWLVLPPVFGKAVKELEF